MSNVLRRFIATTRHSTRAGNAAEQSVQPFVGASWRMLHLPARRVIRLSVARALLLVILGQAGWANSGMIGQMGQTLTSSIDPSLVLRIDPLFEPLPSLKFPIESLTNVDRRVFVDSADEGTIRRLVIVQFEIVQPDATFKFLYPPRPPAEFGDQTYRFNAFVYNDEAEAAKYPAKEAGVTRKFLIARGFKVPRLFRVVRLARVTNQNGMSEVVIFYMENADADFPTGPLAGVDEHGDLPVDAAAAQAILTRLKSVVVPTSG